MLAKNEKNQLFDAHFHVFDVNFHENPLEFWKNLSEKGESYSGITCSFNKEQFLFQEEFCRQCRSIPAVNLSCAFGIHPWHADKNLLPFLEQLLKENRIDAVGECGLDFYTDELKSTASVQTELFESQIQLAIEYEKPLIIHGRKSIQQLTALSDKLKKVPEVLFHSFSGNAVQAQVFLNRGVNGFFSFGRSILIGNKNAVDCVKNLPSERVLAETDAPFQSGNKEFTSLKDIIEITEKINQHKNCN